MIDSWWTAVLSFRDKYWQPVGEERVAMFKQISMTNFKSWRETGPVRMAPLTAFFGANSSGKSSLLQMLLLLKQTAESNDRNLVLNTGSIQTGYVNLGTGHEITYGDTTEMSLSVAWTLNSNPDLAIPIPDELGNITIDRLSFETRIHAEAKNVYVKSLKYRQEKNFSVAMDRKGNNRYTVRVYVNDKEPRRPRHRPRVLMRAEKCYGFSDEALLYYQDASYLRSLEYAFEQHFQNLHYLGPLREYPQRAYPWGGERPTNVGLKGEKAISALLTGKSDKVYNGIRKRKSNRLDTKIAQWLVDLNLASSFRVEQIADSTLYQVWLKRTEESPEVLITDMGIGVSQVLPVLVLCYYVPEGSTIILEQPELHLHPSVQAGLADVFIDVIKNRNVQILLESHSEHLLRRLQRRIAEPENAFLSDDAAIYFCEICDGESKLTPLHLNVFGEIHNWPEDFFGDLLGEMVAVFDAGLERKQLQANGS